MRTDKINQTDPARTKDIVSSLISELLFTFLPFLIVAIIELYKMDQKNFIFLPEWSLASSILAGQTIVKFISGLLKKNYNFRLGIVSLIITGLIVFLLSPSLVILSLIMITNPAPVWLGITQIFLFIASVAGFIILGRVSTAISQE